MRNIGIIGAGPAGIFSAINIKNTNNNVYLLDKNEKIGRKLLITGNGRCNITNAKVYDDFMDHIIRNKEFLYSSFSKFDNFAMIDFLNKNSIETIIEDDDKVFPKSMKASQVVDLFEKLISKKGIKFLAKTEVYNIYKEDTFKLTTNKGIMEFDILVIACGGLSYPKTGSSGDGYKFAKNFGHTIIEPKPSLSPFYLKNSLDLRALSLKNIQISAYGDRQIFSEFGDILLTSKFVSGPAALRLQAKSSRSIIRKVAIDLKKDLSILDLDEELINILNKNSKKNIVNALKGFLNESLVYSILDNIPIPRNKKANQISKIERSKLCDLIKNFSLETKENTNFDSAVVTSGGVKTSELNPKTMESKLVNNLYFVGEVLDVDGLTGGFNLQIAFTTAYSASLAIKEKL